MITYCKVTTGNLFAYLDIYVNMKRRYTRVDKFQGEKLILTTSNIRHSDYNSLFTHKTKENTDTFPLNKFTVEPLT